MEINNRESVLAWLKAWGNNPPIGYLDAAIDGMRTCISLTPRHCPDMAKGYREALEALQRSSK